MKICSSNFGDITALTNSKMQERQKNFNAFQINTKTNL